MNRKKKNPSKAMEAVNAYRNQDKKDKIQTDTQGSYTGVGKDGTKPVQDADDL